MCFSFVAERTCDNKMTVREEEEQQQQEHKEEELLRAKISTLKLVQYKRLIFIYLSIIIMIIMESFHRGSSTK